VANIDPLTGAVIPDLRRTNRFLYEGTIHALYATYGRPFGRFGMLGGLRLEQATVDTNQVTTGVAGTNRYARIYPSLHLLAGDLRRPELQLWPDSEKRPEAGV
jgi:hypothetical protein